MVRRSSAPSAMALRFRREPEVIDHSTSERWRSKNAPALCGLAKLRVRIRVRFSISDHCAVARGAADCVGRKSTVQRVWRDQWIRFELGVREIAGPGIVARVMRHRGPYRIQLDVAHAREEVLIRVDDR